MQSEHPDLAAYLAQMEPLLNIQLDAERRAELLIQFSRISALAAPLMDFPLDERTEVAGVYKA